MILRLFVFVLSVTTAPLVGEDAATQEKNFVIISENQIEGGILKLTRTELPVATAVECAQPPNDSSVQLREPTRAFEYIFLFEQEDGTATGRLHSFIDFEYTDADLKSGVRVLGATGDSANMVVVYKQYHLTLGLVVFDGQVVVPKINNADSGVLARDSEVAGYITSAMIRGSIVNEDLTIELLRSSSLPTSRLKMKRSDDEYVWQEIDATTRPAQ